MLPVTSTGSVKAFEAEPWANCLYNNESIMCRRTFLCETAPCKRFKLEWRDGISDIYSRTRDGMANNVGFYQDTHGGEWLLRGFAGSFALVNQANGNKIIYDMTLVSCQESGLSDLCNSPQQRQNPSQ
jgi:hypothetical protein